VIICPFCKASPFVIYSNGEAGKGVSGDGQNGYLLLSQRIFGVLYRRLSCNQLSKNNKSFPDNPIY
jgi:hypothetical protein